MNVLFTIIFCYIETFYVNKFVLSSVLSIHQSIDFAVTPKSMHQSNFITRCILHGFAEITKCGNRTIHSDYTDFLQFTNRLTHPRINYIIKHDVRLKSTITAEIERLFNIELISTYSHNGSFFYRKKYP